MLSGTIRNRSDQTLEKVAVVLLSGGNPQIAKAEGDALMRENKSWVFFKELIGDGPLGALSVPVRASRSRWA